MQMAKWIVAFVILGLVACGDEPPPCGGYGCHTSYLDEETGVSLRYDRESSISQSQAIEQFKSVSACSGLPAAGTRILFVSESNEFDGRYFFDDETIVIYANAGRLPYIERYVLNHEIIHHLVNRSGACSREDNKNHVPTLFVTCATA